MRNITVKTPPVTIDLESYQMFERWCENQEKDVTVAEGVRRAIMELLVNSIDNKAINPNGLTYATLCATPAPGRPKKPKSREEMPTETPGVSQADRDVKIAEAWEVRKEIIARELAARQAGSEVRAAQPSTVVT